MSEPRDDRAYAFWTRVENRKSGTFLDLATSAGISYKYLKDQRSANRLPKLETAYALAVALGTSVEYLMTGIESISYPTRIKKIADHLCTISSHDLDTVETMVMAIPASQTKSSISMEA